MRADLEEARLQHVGRPQPRGVARRRERAGHGERPVAVEHVVEVEIDPQPIPLKLEPLRSPQIELLQIVGAVIRADRDQIHALRRQVLRIGPAQRRRRGRHGRPRGLDARRLEAGLHAAHELERGAEHDVERQRVRTEQLEVGTVLEILVARFLAVREHFSHFRGGWGGRDDLRHDAGIHQVALIENPFRAVPETRHGRDLETFVDVRLAAERGREHDRAARRDVLGHD